MNRLNSRPFVLSLLTLGVSCYATAGLAQVAEEIQVIGTTPGGGRGVPLNKVPFAVQTVGAEELRESQSTDLTDYMNRRMTSVNINSAQNNPLQPDLQFRGFTASPLLGLPQGLSVYQNGVRINEPLGDAVNWDLLPLSAVANMKVINGADPLFGLNTLGGSLSIDMKNGFNYQGSEVELSGGSWGRITSTLQSGGQLSDNWGYYVNVSTFEEDGWRDLSDSDALNFYGSLGWRDGDISALNLNLQIGQSELTGNGAAPVGLLAVDRTAIFTAPDITENDMTMVSVDGSHFFNDKLQFVGSAFFRENDTDSFNGDGSEFERCDYSGGNVSLFEEAEDIEDDLDDLLGINLDDICDGNDPAITSFIELENFIEQEAQLAGLDPEDFELEDVVDDLYGSGIISDEAVNNISRRVQTSQGFDGKLIFLDDMFGNPNHLTVGFSYFNGESDFDAVLELAGLDPVTRSTEGLGTGTFYTEAETDINTETETWSLFFTNTMDLGDSLALTLAGRYNSSDITLRDQSGARPELNGDHRFTRFNPSVGLTWQSSQDNTWYTSYSESNRVPTPIELACNEGVFELAQQFAIEAGEDPDDIEFECRLPNAFLADPPLDDVVTKSFEFGTRGIFNSVLYQLGLFHATNHDDILFQTTGRQTGLFANVDKTRRMGFESSFSGDVNQLAWYANYSYIQATFEDDYDVLSPNHPQADAEGVIAVSSGDQLPGIPEHIFKLGGDYHLTESFSMGLEMVYNSEQYLRGDESNDLDQVDGYTLFNLRGQYRANDMLLVYATVSNLLDSEYENFGLLGEDPGEIIQLDDDRPVFLGAGAPRAAWIGVRVSF